MPPAVPEPPRSHPPDAPGRARPIIRFWLVVGMVLVATAGLSVLLVAVTSESDDSDRGVTTAEGFDLPALRGGGRVRLSDEVGRPVVVNFFASWCTTCDAELPEFRRVAGELEGKVSFVFVNANDRGRGTEMAARHDLFDFPVALDIGGSRGNGLYRAVGASRGMPITAIYDANGDLVDLHLGGLLDGALERKLEELFG